MTNDNCKNSASPLLLLYHDTDGVEKDKPLYIPQFQLRIIYLKQINIRTLRKDISVFQEALHILNTIVLYFQCIHCLHLTYPEVAWVPLYSGTQRSALINTQSRLPFRLFFCFL